MRKIILSLMAITGLVMFGGCGSAQPLLKTESGQEYRLWDKENGSFSIASRTLTLKQQLNIASKESKKRGYPYFVLLNAGVNNLNGFPVNTYKELERYHTLGSRKQSFATTGYNQNRGNTPLYHTSNKIAPTVWFKPVGQEVANSYISVWSVEQTLRDTK